MVGAASRIGFLAAHKLTFTWGLESREAWAKQKAVLSNITILIFRTILRHAGKGFHVRGSGQREAPGIALPIDPRI